MEDELKTPEKSEVEPATPEGTPKPDVPNIPEDSKPIVDKPKKQNRHIVVLSILFVILALATAAFWYFRIRNISRPPADNEQSVTTTKKETPKVEGLQLDPNKNYGNKYANGILPVGDNKYTTDAAKKGNVYLCKANFVPAGQAGAQTRGPWFIGTTQWDINKKVAVQGKVNWTQRYSMEIKDGKRIIDTNDLPDHHTGVFPVSKSDPAYSYDRNPNTIKTTTLTYELNATPSYGSPQCMNNEVGVMTTGVALFDAFDAGGRDAGAWEVQDDCEGHPQEKGEYHYHTLSSCITDTSVNKVIGYALDGYPITGPKVGENNFLTTDDLDECHGIVSELQVDGKKVTTYHYVMTQDFPYSASCFRSMAVKPPGQMQGAPPQRP